MVCFGFEPWTAEWKAQTNPMSCGGPKMCLFTMQLSNVICHWGIQCDQIGRFFALWATF